MVGCMFTMHKRIYQMSKRDFAASGITALAVVLLLRVTNNVVEVLKWIGNVSKYIRELNKCEQWFGEQLFFWMRGGG